MPTLTSSKLQLVRPVQVDLLLSDKINNATSDDFQHLLELSRLDLKSDFRYLDLQDVDFGRANLEGADFTGANLARAIFFDAKITGSTIFHGANLSGVIWPLESSEQVLNSMSDRIRWLRVSKKLGVEQFSVALGVEPSDVFAWEHDAAAPDLDVLLKIQETFHALAIWIVTGKERLEDLPDISDLDDARRRAETLLDQQLAQVVGSD